MPRLSLGFNQRNFNGSRPTSAAAINMGSMRGKASTSRMFNFCKTHSETPSLCIDKFINITEVVTPPPPPPTTPSAPTITSISPRDQSLLLNFTVPSDGGSPITNYQYSINSGTYTSAGATSSPITITGLTNGTTYSLTLRAVNSVGTGQVSNTLSGTPASPTTFTFINGIEPIIVYDSTISQATYLTGVGTQYDLIEVSIGTSCTTIADNCFNFFNINPSKLQYVTFLGNSVTSIGNYSFAYNSSPFSFSTITIPNSVTSLGEYCFFDCTQLNGTITIPNSVTSLGNACFASCVSLDRIIFQPGSTITSLPTSCFGACSQLSTINIPASVITIGNATFQSCSSLTNGSITFDGTLVTNFFGSTFGYCTGLTSLDFIPSSVTNLGPNIFLGCTGLAGTIQILSTIQNIGFGCFQDCINITSIVIPSSVTIIQANMMQGCTSLTTVIFKNQSTLFFIQQMLLGLSQNIQISFYLLSSADYGSLSTVTQGYFVVSPPSNWNYFYSTNPSPI
jgi:hypothetical protein